MQLIIYHYSIPMLCQTVHTYSKLCSNLVNMRNLFNWYLRIILKSSYLFTPYQSRGNTAIPYQQYWSTFTMTHTNLQSPNVSRCFSKYVLADWDLAPIAIALQSKKLADGHVWNMCGPWCWNITDSIQIKSKWLKFTIAIPCLIIYK